MLLQHSSGPSGPSIATITVTCNENLTSVATLLHSYRLTATVMAFHVSRNTTASSTLASSLRVSLRPIKAGLSCADTTSSLHEATTLISILLSDIVDQPRCALSANMQLHQTTQLHPEGWHKMWVCRSSSQAVLRGQPALTFGCMHGHAHPLGIT